MTDGERIVALVKRTGKPHMYFNTEDRTWYYTQLDIDRCGSGKTMADAYSDHLYMCEYQLSHYNL